METITARNTKDEIITAATEAIDYHSARAAELNRQRIALWVAIGILATILSLR